MPSGGYHLQTKPISIVKSHENQTTHLYFMWNIVTSKKIHNRSPQKMVPTGSPWNKWPPLEPGTRSRRARFWSRRWGQNLSFAACIRSSASDGLAAPNGWRKMSGWYDRFIGSCHRGDAGNQGMLGCMIQMKSRIQLKYTWKWGTWVFVGSSGSYVWYMLIQTYSAYSSQNQGKGKSILVSPELISN